MRTRVVPPALAIAAAAALMVSCGEDALAPIAPPEDVVTVHVSGSRTAFDALGQTVQLSAVATDPQGNSVDVGSFQWTSAAPFVVSVDAAGLATAVSNGVAEVTASAEGVRGSITLRVAQAAARLVLVVEPAGAASGERLATQPVVEVQDANGARLENDHLHTLEATVEGGGLMLGQTTATAVAGQITFTDLGIAGRVGSRQLVFTSVSGSRSLGLAPVRSAPFDLEPGPTNTVAGLKGDAQTGLLNETLSDTLVVMVTDGMGDADPDEPLEWAVTAGNGQLSVIDATTDEHGLGRAIWTLGEVAGANEVEAVVPDRGAVTFTARAVYDPTTRLKLAGSALTSAGEAPLANVYVHGDHAYVGGMSTGYTTSANLGVRIIDVSNPTSPQLVGRIRLRKRAADENHTHGDAIVTDVNTGAFQGAVAVVHNGVPDHISPGESPEPYGVWDVSDPANPAFFSVLEFSKAVSFFDSSDLGDKPRNSKAFVGHHFLALYDHDPGAGQDFRLGIADVSDPRNPVVVGDWNPPVGSVRPLSLSVNASGTRAYLAGPNPGGRQVQELILYVLDIQDPARPVEIGQYTFPATTGNLYSTPSIATTSDDDLLIFCDGGWGDPENGILHFLDISDPANIRKLSTFALPESMQEGGPAAWEVIVKGRIAYSAWFTPGVIAVDFSDPENPLQAGQFRSPNTSEPWLTDLAFIGDDHLAAATVWWSGLYILEAL